MRGQSFGRLLALLGVICLWCACATTSPQTKTTAQADGFDGYMRLEQPVLPLAYALDLSIDPIEGTLSGKSQITVKVNAPTSTIRLHAESLQINSVVLSPLDQPELNIPATFKPARNGGLELTSAQELSAREYALTIQYQGAVTETPTGLYRVKEAERWYAFTQFEPLEARRAFPCFDEPGFKTPFTVSLSVPKGLLALANAPEREQEQRESTPGLNTFHFQTTQPLPTYLVAFAIGDFDVVEAKGLPKKHVPLRVIAPKGKGALAAYSLEKTPPILAALAEFFGQPYPYEKLDLVAVPNFSAGAMENVGLVTFREALLLLDPKTATLAQQQSTQGVIAHELAHMWFGNLVTPKWWDDLWLNESFATWMATFILDKVAPELEAGERQIRSVGYLMNADSLPDTRAIRQPIKNGGDVYNAFDGMTYGKGAAILGMLHEWIGHDAFVAALRVFMVEHAHGSVTTTSLMEALSRASLREVYPVLRQFIDQPGVPQVQVTPSCKGDKLEIKLTQARYMPAQSKLSSGKPWHIPMCFAWPAASGERERHCVVLDAKDKTVVLPAKGCPTWIHPNPDERGYYLWSMPQAQLMALATEHKAALTRRERIGLLSHVGLLVQAQKIKPIVNYDLALAWSDDEDPDTLSRTLGTLASTEELAKSLEMIPQYQALIAARLSPHLKRLGLEPDAEESLATQSLRGQLINWMGYNAQDPYVIATAQSLVPVFLDAPEQMPTFRAAWAIPLAAHTGGDALLFESLRQLLKSTSNPSVRQITLNALGDFSQPELANQALDLFLSDDVRSSELWTLIGPQLSHEVGQERVWAWLKANLPALRQKLGEQSSRSLPWLGARFCTEAKAKEVEALFKGLPKQPTGMDRILNQALSNIRRCEVNRAYNREGVKVLLSRYDAPLATPPASR